MQILWMALMAAGVVAADQLLKLWVVANIPLYARVEALPGLFHLTYVQNTGAAFSSFEGQQWLFLLVFVLFTVAVIWEFSTDKMGFSRFERWCIAAIYAGGLGNMIDRLRLGYVVDMIGLEFVSFPIFNIADCFITCGCIAMIVSLLFVNRKFWKDEKK